MRMNMETIFRYLLIGCLAVLCIAILYELLRNKEKNILDILKEGAKNFHKRIPLVLILTAVYLGVYLLGEILNSTSNAYLTISLNYPSASSGLTPNNTRYNSSEIVSDEVLEDAIAAGGLENVTAAELREAIHISPVVAGDELSLDKYYISTEYRVEFTAAGHLSHLDPEDTLLLIAQAYYDRFVDNYSRKTNILELDYSNMEGVEYLDVTEYLDEKAYEMQQYMNSMSYENPTFQSSESGETFGALAEKIQDYRNVELERFESLVLENGLSRDVGLYTSTLNYENRIKNISYMKNLAAYKVRLETINLYERDMASVVLVPTQDEMGQFYMSRTKLGVDDFADQAKNYRQMATDLKLEIDTNNYAIDKIQSSTAGDGVYQHAEDMLAVLKEELSRFASLAKQIVEEYDAKTMNNYMNVIVPNLSFVQKYDLNVGILLAVAFMCLVSALIIVKPYEEKKKRIPGRVKQGNREKE